MMSGNPIGEETPHLLAIMRHGFLRPAGGMVYGTDIPDDVLLERIRILTDIMEKAARRGSIASVEATPKPPSEDARPAKVPFETFPCLQRLPGATVGVKDTITGIRHALFLPKFRPPLIL
jgi:hypothetical protein